MTDFDAEFANMRRRIEQLERSRGNADEPMPLDSQERAQRLAAATGGVHPISVEGAAGDAGDLSELREKVERHDRILVAIMDELNIEDDIGGEGGGDDTPEGDDENRDEGDGGEEGESGETSDDTTQPRRRRRRKRR